MADIDIEAMNRIRVGLGLKPIAAPAAAGSSDEEDPGSTLELREAAADDNWRKLNADKEVREKRQAQKEAIKKARDAAVRNSRLDGPTLGDAGDGDVGAAAWLKSQAKRRKKIEKARKLEEERAAREEIAQYTEKDLAGVKVGHELDQFADGGEQILTLKDAVIGEESEEDELENIDLREKERLGKKLELKKRKPVYNPNDVDESGEKKLLAQYDEAIDGEEKHHFTLDNMGSTAAFEAKVAEQAHSGTKGVLVSLDFMHDERQPISDYVDASEIKIKKPKKKKSSTRKRAAADDDADAGNDVAAMEVDSPAEPPSKKRSFDEANFVDDDDLQARLAQQRREALKKKKRLRPEDVAKQLREEEEAAMDGVESGDDGGLVFNETTEFVGHLQPEAEEEERERKKLERKPESEERQDPDDSDVEMESYAALEETSDAPAEPSAVDVSATGIEEEATMSQGLGSTLAMLRQRKVLADDDHGGLNVGLRQHESFLAAKRSRAVDAEQRAKTQRERDRASGGALSNMTTREREDYARQSNTQREQHESQAMIDLFNKEYKPNVDIKYVDEYGRRLGPKEAFKDISHQFHGKWSGKHKQEKRLKKIAAEQEREKRSILDSSAHAPTAGGKAKKNQTPGVRLQ
jgi:U4/U6.U5 tri-snRNP-associated protein 1